MFTRTEAGLSSEHLFFDVDWIVYCEGKPLSDDVSSLDEAFWTKVLSANGVSCKCKSMGSKPELKQLAETVIDGSVQRVLVAMDRDYDHLMANLIDHPRVLYSHGYSWESDACQNFSVERVVQLFANVTHIATIESEFRTFRNTMSGKLRRAFALDFKYHNHPENLFDRSKPYSIIEMAGAAGPSIKTGSLIQRAKSIPKHNCPNLSREAYYSACGMRDFYGKAIAKLVYHWFAKRASGLAGNRKIPYDSVMMSMISSMDMCAQESLRNQHYANIANAAVS
ncbi:MULTISPECIES: DUF4435 domain-containing protein [unclassified Sulfitobacter]|uniref:DUF4435 domain-containing protein n=1 Tax=unclassified Sulfitobacter TaxID=196795 RepID=UPI0023E31FB4|nr:MULTISPECIES: DUF4435 domain-containing protein [unclassified Sulfitobacter]MDF3383410.1 hypothetical protein [Sulfitobacter sp. Ks11]MDF3386828.1 hypothetical protein [Sulfitobacter sp. M85]MDF3390248.1 hypothetical protein [Sulfitobacter sp. Ks16]MDF3400885.1 hypothetical protein [Sulfitobacter sp. KE39]MDF3404306.1 hypothetical protein [Sulfitobacter sp. Ks35]